MSEENLLKQLRIIVREEVMSAVAIEVPKAVDKQMQENFLPSINASFVRLEKKIDAGDTSLLHQITDVNTKLTKFEERVEVRFDDLNYRISSLKADMDYRFGSVNMRLLTINNFKESINMRVESLENFVSANLRIKEELDAIKNYDTADLESTSNDSFSKHKSAKKTS